MLNQDFVNFGQINEIKELIVKIGKENNSNTFFNNFYNPVE